MYLYLMQAGVERTEEEVRHDAPLRLFAELRDQVKARQGKARQGKARQGKARQGKARQGKARQGKASLYLFTSFSKRPRW